MAVDEFLITTPHYYRPETREGEILIAGRGFGGSRFAVGPEPLDAIG